MGVVRMVNMHDTPCREEKEVPLSPEDLQRRFAVPTDSVRPQVWWHWLDGNVTLEGITDDLEAMRRAGLGGAIMFSGSMGLPEGSARFLGREWLTLMDHALTEAQRLGMQLGVHDCDGFSQAGGPWITPETSMKKLVCSGRETQGPASIDVTLEQPETLEGHYRDIAVIAFPIPSGAVLTGSGTDAIVRGPLAPTELAKLTDGDPGTRADFPATRDGNTVEFVFPTPRTVRSVVCRNTVPHNWEQPYPIEMEVSTDGEAFQSVGVFTPDWDFLQGGCITAACEEVAGTVFRLTLRNPHPVSIGEIELSETARVHFGEAKAGRMRRRGHGAERTAYVAFPGPARDRQLAPELVIAREAIVDLTARMDACGGLHWDVPPGRWRILRVGFTSTGCRTHPATREGEGLECDKLDAQAMRFHFGQYVGKLKERSDRLDGALVALEIDSWECGIQNWTAGFDQRFRERVGYDLLPFLPALLEGWLVVSAEVTERVLWDWRRFLADQLSENFFSVAAHFARENGLIYVGEAAGRQQYLYDVSYLRSTDVPMGEMWNNTEVGQGVRVDNKAASSIAHTTGKTIVATEAYTSGWEHANWDNHPFSMKPLGDKALCAGVNLFIFHTFAHQPHSPIGPGFTFGPWGLNFNRANTWWEQVHAWTGYLARCQFLLRQGQPVSDVLFYVGEDVPNRIAWRDELRPELPPGYDFDGCDTPSLMEARVSDGRIVLPSGTEYRVLLLPDLPTMRPAVLRHIQMLVDAGAVVIGPRPLHSPSLCDLGAGDETVRRIATELWGGATPRIFSDISFEELFRHIGLSPDFAWEAGTPDAEILYTHRRTEAGELYFLSNQRNRPEEITAAFRTGFGAPEWWDPATGSTRALPECRVEGDRVHVPLRLDPCGSGFVVFRPEDSRQKPKQRFGNWLEFVPVQDIVGPWSVSFPPRLGAPEATSFDSLVSFAERAEPGIRHFSGTATYCHTFMLRDLESSASDLFLDLGRVEVIAEIELNGKNLGVLWKPPFRVCVDGALRAGENHLVVRVTNLWRNRMIGDAALPEDDVHWGPPSYRGGPAAWPGWLLQGKPRPSGRIAFCTRKDVYRATDALLPSGLLGPVSLKRARTPILTNEA
jgi:hypothetical protein